MARVCSLSGDLAGIRPTIQEKDAMTTRSWWRDLWWGSFSGPRPSAVRYGRLKTLEDEIARLEARNRRRSLRNRRTRFPREGLLQERAQLRLGGRQLRGAQRLHHRRRFSPRPANDNTFYNKGPAQHAGPFLKQFSYRFELVVGPPPSERKLRGIRAQRVLSVRRVSGRCLSVSSSPDNVWRISRAERHDAPGANHSTGIGIHGKFPRSLATSWPTPTARQDVA